MVNQFPGPLHRRTALTGALASLAAISGCAPASTAGSASATPTTAPASTPSSTRPSASPSASASASASASQSTTPSKSQQPPAAKTAPKDTRKGAALNKPFTVDGVIVVSKKHRITARYVPDWAGREWGLKPEALKAFQRLSADAADDGRTLVIRSAYRDFATQQASFEQAMRDYDEATARKYYAEAGASEHQTGLALDAWDGVNRGSAFTALPEAKWLGKNCYKYGFIVRYPEGKTDITGYAYESWHLRWVGKDISKEFGPNSTLTLEEYLGLA